MNEDNGEQASDLRGAIDRYPNAGRLDFQTIAPNRHSLSCPWT